jgi:hypothetical protein
MELRNIPEIYVAKVSPGLFVLMLKGICGQFYLTVTVAATFRLLAL